MGKKVICSREMKKKTPRVENLIEKKLDPQISIET